MMKVYFTFDPFEENKWNRNHLKNLIAGLTNEDDSLKAVYVASKSEVNLTTAYDVAEEERYSDYPQRLMRAELKDLGIKASAEVITENSMSQTVAVEKLSKNLLKNKADLVLISTNAKSLLPRMVFGSFAETLVHSSQTDLLVYHQKTKISSNAPKVVYYAHDFSAKGDQGFERVCLYAAKWECTLNVIHITSPETDSKKIEAKAKKIQKLLNELEIEGAVEFETTHEDYSDLILELSTENRANIIALAAQTGNNESLLGGNIVRKILRQSKLPTLVLKV